MKKLMTSLFLTSTLTLINYNNRNKKTNINNNPNKNNKITPQETPQNLKKSYQINDN